MVEVVEEQVLAVEQAQVVEMSVNFPKADLEPKSRPTCYHQQMHSMQVEQVAEARVEMASVEVASVEAA